MESLERQEQRSFAESELWNEQSSQIALCETKETQTILNTNNPNLNEKIYICMFIKNNEWNVLQLPTK